VLGICGNNAWRGNASSRFERAARGNWAGPASPGIDEAGRGALFGPVWWAAAVIPHPKRRIVGLDDSKNYSRRRTELRTRIREHAIGLGGRRSRPPRASTPGTSITAQRQAMTAAATAHAFDPADYLLIAPLQLDVFDEQNR